MHLKYEQIIIFITCTNSWCSLYIWKVSVTQTYREDSLAKQGLAELVNFSASSSLIPCSVVYLFGIAAEQHCMYLCIINAPNSWMIKDTSHTNTIQTKIMNSPVNQDTNLLFVLENSISQSMFIRAPSPQTDEPYIFLRNMC